MTEDKDLVAEVGNLAIQRVEAQTGEYLLCLAGHINQMLGRDGVKFDRASAKLVKQAMRLHEGDHLGVTAKNEVKTVWYAKYPTDICREFLWRLCDAMNEKREEHPALHTIRGKR